jgi:hypothetical protein
MTPIERVQRRAEAARRLDVSIYSPADVLKATWRKRAFEVHPDRNGGSDAAFKELQLAYEILAGTAADHMHFAVTPDAKAKVSPGAIRPRRVVSRTPSRVERPVY